MGIRLKHFRIFLLLDISLSIFPTSSFSQLKTNLIIQFPFEIDTKMVELRFDDGRGEKQIFPEIRNNRAAVKEYYYTEFGIVSLTYPVNDNMLTSRTFFVTSKPASVRIIGGIQPGGRLVMKNAIEAYSTPGGKKLSSVLKNDGDSLVAIAVEMGKPGVNLDSLQKRSHYFDSLLLAKQTQFMKNNPGDFFSLWQFKERYIPSYFFYPPDTIKNMFLSWFPEKSRQSRMGKEIKKIIDGRITGMYGGQAPLFSARDINNKTVSLNKLKGKYVLLDFWASWCMPCIEEIPLLKKVSKEFDTSFIEIISINIETDSLAFIKAKEKFEMNWTHIFNNKEVVNLYGTTPIPALYLVDRQGNIIYSHFKAATPGFMQMLEDRRKAEIVPDN